MGLVTSLINKVLHGEDSEGFILNRLFVKVMLIAGVILVMSAVPAVRCS